MVCFSCATELDLNIPVGRVNPDLIDVDPGLIHSCPSCGCGSIDFSVYHLLKSQNNAQGAK